MKGLDNVVVVDIIHLDLIHWISDFWRFKLVTIEEEDLLSMISGPIGAFFVAVCS